MTDKLLNLLGLALRGGNLAAGEEPVSEACRTGRARLVLAAADAAGNSIDRAGRLAERAGIPFAVLPRTKEQAGAALGRSSCAVAALTDAGLAAALAAKLAEEDESSRPLAEELNERAGRIGRPQKEKTDPRSARTAAIRRWPV